MHKPYHYRIPENVTEIGWEAFRDCTGLTTIKIPDSVTGIGEDAFSGVPHIVYHGSTTSGDNRGTKRLARE